MFVYGMEWLQVKFVRVDARCEWICLSSVRQAENLLVNQLLHSKDVLAQTEAITGELSFLRLGAATLVCYLVCQN